MQFAKNDCEAKLEAKKAKEKPRPTTSGKWQ